MDTDDRDRDRDGGDAEPVRDVLKVFGAEEIVEDPTGVEGEPAEEPAATPDSPDPS